MQKNRKEATKKVPARRSPTAEEISEATDLIKKAIAKGGPNALSNIKPIAIEARLLPEFDPTDDATFLSPSVEVTPVVNPLFRAVMIALGYDLLGDRSFAIGAGQKLPGKIILSTLEAIPGDMLRSARGAERVHSSGLDHASYASRSSWEIERELSECPAGSKLDYKKINDALFNSKGGAYKQFHANKTEERYREHSLVSLSTNKTQIIISVATAWVNNAGGKGLFFWDDAPDLHLLRIKGKRDAVRVTPAEALALLESAKAWGFQPHDGGGISALKNRVEETFLVKAISGSPGRAEIIAGQASLKGIKKEYLDLLDPLGDSSFMSLKTTARQAASIAKKATRGKADRRITDPHVLDIMKMEDAKATGKRNPLRPYQDEAVSLHLTTEYGYVNACAPGLGKTLMALFAQKEKAATKKGYRSLVVTPAAIRSQWIGEAKKYFPKAHTRDMTAHEVESDLDDFFRDAGDNPAILFLSYDAMRASADKLAQTTWDDLICDEAAVLGSTGTGRTKALWQLRHNARTAVALTGTPINRSLDDLGHIVSWSRGDESAFHGQKLSRRFDMSRDSDVVELWDSLGPVVFRRDRSEIADQLPHIETEVIQLDPEKAEKALANGAREELKKIYETLQTKLEIAETLRPNDPKVKRAKKEMQKIRGAVLGGVTLARMAASDPHSLLAKKDKSAGVALLEAAGLVAAATKNKGTKRRMIVELTDDLVGQNDAVLIFTDFSSVAKGLARDLQEKGVRVSTFTGEDSAKKREAAARDFQDGKLDCLVLTGAGREGLNLQRASVLIHYDLPWVPSQVVQRVGRASRFGSTSDKLQVLIPIMKGTIEERVAGILVPRAVEALRALDTHRGVKGGETEVGLAIAGLDEAASDDGKNSGLFHLAEEVLKKEED